MTKVLVSVITPIYQPNLGQLRHCLLSVGKHDGIEHILGVDGPDAVDNLQEFQKLASEFGARIVTLDSHGGISKATNLAVSAANGELLLLLDQDDFLLQGWQEELLPLVGEFEFIYSDRHAAQEDGTIIANQVFFKPDWSPHRLLGNMYVSHFFAINRALFNELGGMRSVFDGSQDHDLAIRASEKNPGVKHIDVPLYAWRQTATSTALNPAAKSYAVDAGVKAINEHHVRTNSGMVTNAHPQYPGFYIHTYPSRTEPVSVIIPTGFALNEAGAPIVRQAMASLENQLTKEKDEVVIVSSTEDDKGTLDWARTTLKCNVVHLIDTEPFNFSRRVNLGALQSTNQLIMFLNDDVEFHSDSSLDSLAYLSQMENVGAVGVKLFFPDGRLQHAGHAYYNLGAHHPYYLTQDFTQNFGDLILDREVSGVTAACLMQRKSVWESVGGFTHELPSNYNDVDFCLKIREKGYSIVQLNSVTATHYESTTRDPTLQDWEVRFIRHRWAHRMWQDRFTRVQELKTD